MQSKSNRREFIQASAAALIAAMHAPAMLSSSKVQAVKNDSEGPVLLSKLRLRSNDLDAQEPFYRDVLGLPVERPTAERLIVTVGPSKIEFLPDPQSENPFYHVAFTIPENLLDASLEWLQPRCPVLAMNPRGGKIRHFPHWNAHSIFYLDPVGNILEFIAHHELNNQSSEPFGPKQILFASEIGLVVPDVPATVSVIQERFGQTPFRGLTSNGFTAMGDMRGLVLVVKEGRGWLPIQRIKAQVFPTEVTIGHGRDTPEVTVDGLPYVLRRD